MRRKHGFFVLVNLTISGKRVVVLENEGPLV